MWYGAYTYPENIVFRGSRHSLLHGLVQLLFCRQISRDGPSNLRPNVMQCAQASLRARRIDDDPTPPPLPPSLPRHICQAESLHKVYMGTSNFPQGGGIQGFTQEDGTLEGDVRALESTMVGKSKTIRAVCTGHTA